MTTDHRSQRAPTDAKRTFRITIPLLMALWVAAFPATVPAVAQQQELPVGFQVGEAFPTLAFPALEDGQPTSMADFRGERLILHVFASW